MSSASRVVVLVALSAIFVRPASSSPHDCAARLASDPGAVETAKCFYGAARGEPAGGPARRTMERVAQSPGRPWFDFYLGYLSWTDRPAAEDRFRRAADGFASTGDASGESLARYQRQRFLGWLNRPDERAAEQERIYALARSSKRRDVRVWAGLARATDLIAASEDLERAYEILHAMEIPTPMVEETAARKERLLLLGHVCLEIGRIDEARAAYGEQIELAIANGDLYGEANVRYNLATLAYQELREAPTPARRSETETLARAALEAAERAQHPTVPVDASWVLGMVTPGETGRHHFESCIRLAEAAGPDYRRRSLCLAPLATRIAADEPERARRILGEAMELAERSTDDWAVLRAWQESIRVAWSTDPPEQALRFSSEALDAIESLRDRQELGSAVQAGVFSVWSDDYAWLAGRILLSAESGQGVEPATDEAFRVIERMRARALTDWLEVATPESAGESPRDFSTLADVRRFLRPDEALLSFVVAPWEDPIGEFGGGSWLLAATREDVSVHRLPGRVELRHGVRSFAGLVARRDGAEIRAAVRLYDDLLSEALSGLPDSVDRLILVPDDALHRLPFAALRALEDADPLGARFELVQVPSATLWLRWRNAPPVPAPEPLLVLADPEPPGAAGGEAGPAPTLAAVRGGVGDRSAAEVFERLPHAQQEGEAALRALGGGLLLVGAEASEAAVRRLPLRDFGILHVAGHARNDEDRPERSMVVLAAAEGAGGPDGAADRDGYLRSAEIARLDLGGRLVVLAACESAGGSTLRGEGVMSLARAFFQAGSHTVVASLWRLRDDDSAAMFDRVYRHLGRGESAAAALRAARREAIEAGDPAAAWAGLVVLGDGSLVPVPGGRGPGWPAIAVWTALGIVLLLGGVVAWRRRGGRMSLRYEPGSQTRR